MINMHKQNAMGKSIGFKVSAPEKLAKGGPVGAKSMAPKGTMAPIKGQPMSPLTKAKMNNGIPGFKKGGACK